MAVDVFLKNLQNFREPSELAASTPRILGDSWESPLSRGRRNVSGLDGLDEGAPLRYSGMRILIWAGEQL